MSSGIDQIPSELLQAGGNILNSEIRRLTNSIWNMEELPQQCRKCTVVPIYENGIKLTVVIYRNIIVANYIQNSI
jgi:hypothetical protein